MSGLKSRAKSLALCEGNPVLTWGGEIVSGVEKLLLTPEML